MVPLSCFLGLMVEPLSLYSSLVRGSYGLTFSKQTFPQILKIQPEGANAKLGGGVYTEENMQAHIARRYYLNIPAPAGSTQRARVF